MFSSSNKYTVCGVLLVLSLALCNTMANDNSVDPRTPRTCYSCEGINCLRVTKLNVTTECTDLLDYCVTVFRGFTVEARGCYGQLKSSYRAKCDLADHPECVKCFGNSCNDKGRADFKCIECKSSMDKKCATDTSDMIAVQCPVPTAQNSYCFVRKSDEEGTTRGCFVHQLNQERCLSDTKCSLCLSDDAEACNSYNLLSQRGAGVSSVVSNVNIIASTVILTVLASVVRAI